MADNVAYEGAGFRIVFAVLRDGTAPGLEFFNGLEDRWKAQLLVLFERLGDEGRINNKEKFKKIEGTGYFEFKAFQVRMPCYFTRDRQVVITHGFRKQADRIRTSELRRAENIKTEYERILQQERTTGEESQ